MREKVMLRVIKGALVPADDYATEQLRSRGFRTGDLLQADLVKPRNSRFNRLVHAIGKLVAENIEGLGPDGHAALKTIQLEAGLACDKQKMEIPGVGECLVTIPKSLSFNSMDEGEFHQLAQDMCAYIAANYWPSMSAEQVQAMAERFIE